MTRGIWAEKWSKLRLRHSLWALKRNTLAFFGLNQDLMAAFDQLQQKDQIPVNEEHVRLVASEIF